MRFILLLIFTFIHGCSCTGVFANTLKAKGQAESDASYSDVFRMEAPNKSLTKIGDKKVLIETGNENWLANSGFEAPEESDAIPGWFKHSSVAWDPVTNGDHKALKLSVVAGTYSNGDLVFQSETITSKGDNTGRNLKGKLRIKSANAGYKLCAIVDSVTEHCTDIIADSTRYIDYSTAIFSGGGSSTEYKLGIYHKAHTVASTQDIFVDDGKLGPTDIAMGTPSNTFTAHITGTATVALETGPIMDWISSCSVSDTSLYTCSFNTGVFSTSPPTCLITAMNSDLSILESAAFLNSAATTSQISYRTEVAGVKSALSIKLSCTRTGSDYIQGARVSDGYDGQDVALRAGKQPAQSIPNNTTTTLSNYSSVTLSEHVDFDTATGIATIKTAGLYDISASVAWSNNATGNRLVLIQINGTGYRAVSDVPGHANSNSTGTPRTLEKLNVGDTVRVNVIQTSGGALNTHADSAYNYLLIRKETGAAYMTPIGSVSMRAYNVSQQTITPNTETVITGWTKDDDTHGVLNAAAGVATVAEDGTYSGIASLFFTNPASGWAATNSIEIYVTVNGSRKAGGYYVFRSTSSVYSDVVHAPFTGLKLKRGDILNVRVYIGGISGNVQLPNNSTLNRFSFTKTGP